MTIEIVGNADDEQDRLIFISDSDSVWITFARPWWAVAAWLWWWLTPGSKKWLQVSTDGKKVRLRAVRIARKYVRIGARKSE